jgi:hypothetical protein
MRARLGLSFFGSRAFAPERAILKLTGKYDTSREALRRLSWESGDRFAAWTVSAKQEDGNSLTLDWAMPQLRSWGVQHLRADLINDLLRVTISTGIVHISATSMPGSAGEKYARGVADNALLFFHDIYARVLTRATAEELGRLM